MKVFLILAAFILVCAPVAEAGTLSIKAEAAVSTGENQLHITAKASNHGDEAAHNVQTNIILLGEYLKGPVKALLGVNQSVTFHVEKALSGIKQGRYPLTVVVDFHDANKYPFSALVGTTFHYGKNVDPNLLGLVHDLTMEKYGALRLRVQNPGDHPKHIRATAVLPRELSVPHPELTFQVNTNTEKTVAFEILNLSALPGASYPVFCYLEYDLRETHYTTVAKGIVKIAKRENWLQRTVWLWIGSAVLLGIGIVVYQFKGK